MKKNFIQLITLMAAAWLLSAPLQAQSGASKSYQEGVHYFLIEDGPYAPEASTELVEVFSYLCTHCYTFEPYIDSWAERHAETVKFSRIPVVFGRKPWEIYARAYVTAQMMGLGSEAHSAMMDKLWKEKSKMRSMEELAEFYGDFDIDPKSFIATSKSFAVDARMRKEQRLIQTYGVRATPTLILNGKYRIGSNAAVQSFDAMLDVVEFLIASGAE